jgi:hypothetical protein
MYMPPNISMFSQTSSVVKTLSTPSKVSSQKLPVLISSIVNSGISKNSLIGTNGLIRTIGLIGENGTEVSVGPQPLPPGLVGVNGLIGENGYIMSPISPETTQYHTQTHVIGYDASRNPITANLMRQISLSPNGTYWEQYWFSHTYQTGAGAWFIPIYHLIISPSYTSNSTHSESCNINNTLYNTPVMCIKLSDKEFYKNLWDATENAKMIFFPNPDEWMTRVGGAIKITGFDAY